MKQILIAITSISLSGLVSCQSEAGKKAEEERIKAEKSLDSIQQINASLKPYLECTIDLMTKGASEEEACNSCKEIYPKGFYYDSINSANDLKKDSVK
jgi:hypothetical protein